MRLRALATAGACACVLSIVGAGSASAATEVGDNCQATNPLGNNFTGFQSKKSAANPLPISAPSGGIVTRWKVASKIPSEFVEQLKVLRSVGGNKYFTAAESSQGTILQGENVFETRIPVQAGDVFAAAVGLSSSVIYCPSADGNDEMSYTPTNASVGSTNEYLKAANIRIPIVAVIEADADNDGYGDESQDKCPRSASIQAVACPLITLGTYGLASKSSALVLTSASSDSTVSVSATVTVPKRGKKKARTLTIFGGSKPVSPGQVVPFTLAFSASLKSALAALPKKKKLTLRATATTTDLAGQASSSEVAMKLKGQQKKAKHKKKKPKK